MSDHKHILELIPAYALGCLDDDDAELAADHLATCPDCQAELAAYQQVTAEFALAVPAATPPASLRHRLRESIRPAPTIEATPAASWWANLIGVLRRPVPAWSLASLTVLLLVAGLWLVNTWPSSSPPASPMQTVALMSTEASPGAQGLLVIGSDGNQGALVVEDLPALNIGQQYQLWLIDAQGERTSGAIFSVDDQGYAAAMVFSPQPLASYKACGVTIEPAGGSPGPTGQKVLGGTF
jgi:anti-sigma-K factor RskA